MGDIVDKLAWTPVRNRAIPFARTRGKLVFYNLGGKRKPGESDVEALQRELWEEAHIRLRPETIRHVHTFEGPCHGAPEGTILKMACYDGESDREPLPSSEIEQILWFTSADMGMTTPVGQMILRWFKERNIID